MRHLAASVLNSALTRDPVLGLGGGGGGGEGWGWVFFFFGGGGECWV